MLFYASFFLLSGLFQRSTFYQLSEKRFTRQPFFVKRDLVKKGHKNRKNKIDQNFFLISTTEQLLFIGKLFIFLNWLKCTKKTDLKTVIEVH